MKRRAALVTFLGLYSVSCPAAESPDAFESYECKVAAHAEIYSSGGEKAATVPGADSVYGDDFVLKLSHKTINDPFCVEGYKAMAAAYCKARYQATIFLHGTIIMYGDTLVEFRGFTILDSLVLNGNGYVLHYHMGDTLVTRTGICKLQASAP